eukprot:210289_1
MSGHIGLRLFQQLKAIDSDVSRDDYFDEEHNTWDVEALEEDLKVTQDRLTHTGSITLPNHTHVPQQAPHGSSLLLLNAPPIHTSQSNELVLSNTNAMHNTTDHHHHHNALSTPINFGELHPPHHTLHHTLQPSTQRAINEDIDLSRTVSSQQTTDTTPSQMPSPNASPSIEYDASQTESDTDHMQMVAPPNNTLNLNRNIVHTHRITNGIQTTAMKKGIKRKAENAIHSVSKKRKIEPHHILNKWNEVALKKLHSLKRQVKNSAWFWEPVNEVKHSAPHYYLVCPMASDYGTICTKLEAYGYYDLDQFLRDCEL